MSGFQHWNAVWAAFSSVAAADSRPNILMCIADDSSYPHLGAYGYPHRLRFVRRLSEVLGSPECEPIGLARPAPDRGRVGIRLSRRY